MQWLLIQTPEGDMHAWALTASSGEPALPPQGELETVVRKHVPNAVIETYTGRRATILLPADTEISKRSSIAHDARMRALAHE